jgi:hypothetical protein
MEGMYKQLDWVKYKDGRLPIPLGHIIEVFPDGTVLVSVAPNKEITIKGSEIVVCAATGK